MVGSDHDLDYPPYLHRQPAAEAAASRRTKMVETQNPSPQPDRHGIVRKGAPPPPKRSRGAPEHLYIVMLVLSLAAIVIIIVTVAA